MAPSPPARSSLRSLEEMIDAEPHAETKRMLQIGVELADSLAPRLRANQLDLVEMAADKGGATKASGKEWLRMERDIATIREAAIQNEKTIRDLSARCTMRDKIERLREELSDRTHELDQREILIERKEREQLEQRESRMFQDLTELMSNGFDALQSSTESLSQDLQDQRHSIAQLSSALEEQSNSMVDVLDRLTAIETLSAKFEDQASTLEQIQCASSSSVTTLGRISKHCKKTSKACQVNETSSNDISAGLMLIQDHLEAMRKESRDAANDHDMDDAGRRTRPRERTEEAPAHQSPIPPTRPIVRKRKASEMLGPAVLGSSDLTNMLRGLSRDAAADLVTDTVLRDVHLELDGMTEDARRATRSKVEIIASKQSIVEGRWREGCFATKSNKRKSIHAKDGVNACSDCVRRKTPCIWLSAGKPRLLPLREMDRQDGGVLGDTRVYWRD